MKKNDARIIVNLNLTDEELEKRVELGVEEYIEKIIHSEKIENLIKSKTESIIYNRIVSIFDNSYYNNIKFNYKGASHKMTEIIRMMVDEEVMKYLNEATIAKAVVKKLGMIFENEETTNNG